MHTETNTWQGPKGNEAVDWLWKEWANVLRLRNSTACRWSGFTWYSLTDQIDWDKRPARGTSGVLNPLGLFDLERKIRPGWRSVLPAHRRLEHRAADPKPLCLTLPLDPSGEQPLISSSPRD